MPRKSTGNRKVNQCRSSRLVKDIISRSRRTRILSNVSSTMALRLSVEPQLSRPIRIRNHAHQVKSRITWEKPPKISIPTMNVVPMLRAPTTRTETSTRRVVVLPRSSTEENRPTGDPPTARLRSVVTSERLQPDAIPYSTTITRLRPCDLPGPSKPTWIYQCPSHSYWQPKKTDAMGAPKSSRAPDLQIPDLFQDDPELAEILDRDSDITEYSNRLRGAIDPVYDERAVRRILTEIVSEVTRKVSRQVRELGEAPPNETVDYAWLWT